MNKEILEAIIKIHNESSICVKMMNNANVTELAKENISSENPINFIQKNMQKFSKFEGETASEIYRKNKGKSEFIKHFNELFIYNN